MAPWGRSGRCGAGADVAMCGGGQMMCCQATPVCGLAAMLSLGRRSTQRCCVCVCVCVWIVLHSDHYCQPTSKRWINHVLHSYSVSHRFTASGLLSPSVCLRKSSHRRPCAFVCFPLIERTSCVYFWAHPSFYFLVFLFLHFFSCRFRAVD